MSGVDSPIRAILRRAPVIPVFTPPETVADAVQVAKALQRGGLSVVEITLRVPSAVPAIKAIAEAVPGMVVGAGTVRDAAQIVAVKAAGGRFAVSPGTTPRLYAAAQDADLPFLPGVATASELMQGLELGFDTFKFFPAMPMGGVATLSAWGSVFAQARFCPTGSIRADGAADFLRLGNVLCIGGSWLTRKELVQAGDWSAIEERARTAVALGNPG